MKQPELGYKVIELRQQKGWTQEKLAEFCEVSTRTIQRIESGEVDPRSFTIQRLSDALEFDFCEDMAQNETFWLALLHLSNVTCIIVIPLLIWTWMKNKSYQVDRHGRDVLNFQITITLCLFTTAILLFLAVPLKIILGQQTQVLPPVNIGVGELMILLMPVPFVLIGLFAVYQGVVNTVRVLSENPIGIRSVFLF